MPIVGLALLAAGVLLIIKTEWFLNNFGRIEFFEDKLGSSGGSRLGYKLVGAIFIFLGVIFVTGLGGSFMAWILSPLLRYNTPAA